MTRISLRDLFWLTLVVGLSITWWLDTRQRVTTEKELRDKSAEQERDIGRFVNELNRLVQENIKLRGGEGGFAIYR